MPQDLTQASKWLLDYNDCSLEELRAFIKDRTGATVDVVDEKETLTAHLRKLDQAFRFPRFMELPAELRVNVYEALLVDDRARTEKGWLIGDEGCRLHTAVLRTSKQVYCEALPILYNQNRFGIRIGYTGEGPRPAGHEDCGLRILQPGHRRSFHTRALFWGRDYPGWRTFYAKPPLDMLRALKHLTIDLGLVTPWNPLLYYPAEAREAVTAVCLMLAGAGKLEILTIKVDIEDGRAARADLAEIFWPLIFLRTEVAVKFDGILEVLQREASSDCEQRAQQRAWLSPRAQILFGSLVARIRKCCTEKTLWEPDPRLLDRTIDNLNMMGCWVGMTDIVNSTAKWRGLQNQADALELLYSTQQSGGVTKRMR